MIRVFERIIAFIMGLFRRPEPEPGPGPMPAPALSLPHPEEPPDYTQTAETADLDNVFDGWFLQWGVPPEHREYWRHAIEVLVCNVYPDYLFQWWPYFNPDTPSVTYELAGVRHLLIKPAWLNPGVIAHEQAHNSFALLTLNDFAAFIIAHASLKDTDPLVKLLYSINPYGLTSDVEAHAEIYRYLGQSMPRELKQFYPKLI